jgi:hypothetical protein
LPNEGRLYRNVPSLLTLSKGKRYAGGRNQVLHLLAWRRAATSIAKADSWKRRSSAVAGELEGGIAWRLRDLEQRLFGVA